MRLKEKLGLSSPSCFFRLIVCCVILTTVLIAILNNGSMSFTYRERYNKFKVLKSTRNKEDTTTYDEFQTLALIRNVTNSKQRKKVTIPLSESYSTVENSSHSSIQRFVAVNKTETSKQDRNQSSPYLGKQTNKITSTILKSYSPEKNANFSSAELSIDVNKTKIKTCNQNRTQSFPYLSGIHSDPPLDIDFKRGKFVYNIELDYLIWMVSVWSTAEYCHAEGWLGKTKTTRKVFVVGISKATKIPIYVVDIGVAEPNKVKPAQYTLILTRRSRGKRGRFPKKVNHNVCLMRQECDKMIFPKEPCGLQATGNDSWNTVKTQNAKLPECESGNEPGAWLVPCADCSDANSCYWKQALWQPNKCSHHRPSLKAVQRSYDGKNILFLGDSTLRGIMYYMMEYINGSLTEWEMSHESLVYNNINRGRTNVSFLYYLGLQKDPPPINVALKTLVNMSQPVKNSSSTVLVVGRFKSLDNSDFPLLMSTLKELGLTGIKLVMKTMGSNRCK
ncbi:unnamed protein product, partial [Owenia fusiformis]